ncbi:cytochrome oxidase maturation protein, cbb3-type [Cyclonatronum proteinivorum]|uniref:Cytochrome oxidase maturation protein, cbb3-type n=1 Tax=Cyclonatronum proteinivorum TaxID=1457365 RepID=A0A345UNX6_9BACT|nr:cbb3-type cytochrome oxidase assembly protein CcoS [Cyclonatronum proteinivorum]AXJ02178.1 cytochrome oxidase maturation protein, cbb3-type [Cyclonatronum proteinivorum]
MSVMYMLIAFSLILAAMFLLAFIWAMRDGQYEDKYTPSVRILFDDAPIEQDEDSKEHPSIQQQQQQQRNETKKH